MRVLRTALALGALAVSVPVMAQGNRNGWDRSRAGGGRDVQGGGVAQGGRDAQGGGVAQRGRDAQGGRDVQGGGVAQGGRNDGNGNNRVAQRSESRNDNRNDVRGGNRGEGRGNGRVDVRPSRGPDERYDRRDAPRIVVRQPAAERYDYRNGRGNGRYVPYGGGGVYRYGDRDFRQRDVLTISAFFRNVGPSGLSVYGSYGRGLGAGYAFRPGLYLSMSVFSRLDVLPYDLELELGQLPWYLERRIYGRTVLVVDTRSQVIVDIYEIDY